MHFDQNKTPAICNAGKASYIVSICATHALDLLREVKLQMNLIPPLPQKMTAHKCDETGIRFASCLSGFGERKFNFFKVNS